MSESALLVVSPEQELSIDYSANQSATGYLRLKNISSGFVAFKVKTNAKDGFFVRPNQGMLSIGEEKELSVTVQHTSELPNKNHRLLIEAAKTSSNFQSNELTEFWKDAKPTQNFKLGVRYENKFSEEIKETAENAIPKHDSVDDLPPPDRKEKAKPIENSKQNRNLVFIAGAMLILLITGYFAFLY